MHLSSFVPFRAFVPNLARADDQVRRSSDGNIFLALFAAVALAGLLSYGVSQFIRGPLTASTNITRANFAHQQMITAGRLIIATSGTQTGGGDCDSDGYIEPMPYRDAAANPHPTGGGYIPATIGATKVDPWGTEYGYCVWDAGPNTLMPICQTSGADYRLAGAAPSVAHPTKSNTQIVIALISAGKDKVFDTTCNTFADIDDDAVADIPLVQKTSGKDDIIVQYTYDEAKAAGGDLWFLKSGAPDTATISKNVEIASGQTLEFADNARLMLPTDTELTDAECTGNAPTQVNEGALRLNMSSSPPALEICYDSDPTAGYHWEWGSSSAGAASIDALSDGVADYTTLFNVFLGEDNGELATGTHNTSVGYHALNSLTTGSDNVAMGYNALTNNQARNHMVAIGSGALRSVVDDGVWVDGMVGIGSNALASVYGGCCNVAVGYDAAASQATADNVTAIGYNALRNTLGGDNTCVGAHCLKENTWGGMNVALGLKSMVSNTDGSNNVAIGSGQSGGFNGALGNNLTGNDNVAIGSRALVSNVGGNESVAIGSNAMRYMSSNGSSFVSYNTAVGTGAMQGAVGNEAGNTGAYNTAIGYNALYSLVSGEYNVAVGTRSLQDINGGSYNTAIGYGALATNANGGYSTAVGFEAMANANDQSVTTYNTAVGFQALKGSNSPSSNSGTENTVVGYGALYQNMSGTRNSSLGVYTLMNNTTGSENIAVGGGALATNVAGNQSTAVGYNAMRYAASSGASFISANTAVGYQALLGSTSAAANIGRNNTAIGHNAMRDNSYGQDNVAIGTSTLLKNIGGANNVTLGNNTMRDNEYGLANVAIGSSALMQNTNGEDNVAIGNASLQSNLFGQRNVAIGTGALYVADQEITSTAVGYMALAYYKGAGDGNNNAFGANAMTGFYVTTGDPADYSVGVENSAFGNSALYSILDGSYNNAFGNEALFKNSSGSNNNAFGWSALRNNTTGMSNNAMGYEALRANTTGANNVAIGMRVLELNTTGGNNVGIGWYALNKGTAGSNNVALGWQALRDTTGSGNIGIGNSALYKNTSGAGNVGIGLQALPDTTGNYNVGIGQQSLYKNTTGIGNTAVGYYAGGFGASANTTGNYNTYVGYSTSGNGVAYTNSTALGNGASITASNIIVLGNTAITQIRAQVTSITAISDMRKKKDIEDSDLGLDFINALHPVSYRFNNGDDTLRYGLIAQEVEKALPDRLKPLVGQGEKGVALLTRDTDKEKTYRLTYGELTAPLIRAVQEIYAALQNFIKETRQAIKDIMTVNDSQDAEIKELRQQIEALRTACLPAANAGKNAANSKIQPSIPAKTNISAAALSQRAEELR